MPSKHCKSRHTGDGTGALVALFSKGLASTTGKLNKVKAVASKASHEKKRCQFGRLYSSSIVIVVQTFWLFSIKIDKLAKMIYWLFRQNKKRTLTPLKKLTRHYSRYYFLCQWESGKI